MKIEKNSVIYFFFGCFLGVLLAIIVIKGFTIIHDIAVAKTRETAIVDIYIQCQKFYEQNKRATYSSDELVKFCKKQYPTEYPYLDILENGSIQYFRLSDDTWLIFALDGGIGFIVAERVKAGKFYHRKLVKIKPRYEVLESEEYSAPD